jgi:hypothetical protein
MRIHEYIYAHDITMNKGVNFETGGKGKALT